jgi:hypothetical protein
MPNGAQTIQLAGQGIQNLQGLQFLPISALQVGMKIIFLNHYSTIVFVR